MNRLLKRLLPAALGIASFALPVVARADLIPSTTNVSSDAPVQQLGFHALNSNDFTADSLLGIIGPLFDRGYTVFFAVLSSLAVLLLIWAGTQYITANGQADKIKKARQSILNILLAIVLLICSYALLGTIIGVLQSVANSAAG